MPLAILGRHGHRFNLPITAASGEYLLIRCQGDRVRPGHVQVRDLALLHQQIILPPKRCCRAKEMKENVTATVSGDHPRVIGQRRGGGQAMCRVVDARDDDVVICARSKRQIRRGDLCVAGQLGPAYSL